MSELPLVSIIITTYKRSTMLKRAIDSVLDQTYRNIEVIVVDDNNPESFDRKETVKVMENYKLNKSVKYIKHLENKNGSAARNTGIENSKGDIVAFLDDDDWFLPEKIELQVEYLVNNRIFDAVYCGWNRDNIKVVPKLEGELSFELLSGRNLIYTNTILMWKNVAISIGGWDEGFSRNQEAVFLLRFFNHGHNIGVVSKVLLCFDTSDRSNALNATKNKEQFDLFLKKHESMILACEKKIKYAKKIIYSYRYRGVLLAFLKEKDLRGAFGIYLSMLKYIPVTFNLYLFKYIYQRLIKGKLK